MHSTGHLLGHAHALNLDEVSHILTSIRVSELTLHQLLLLWHLWLHLELDIVENTFKVDWIELYWHLYCRILLEMDEWGLALFGINHTSGTFNTLALLICNLFTIKDHQRNETLDHNHSVVWLASDRVVDQRKVEKIWKLCEFLDLKQLLNPVVGDVERLELL